MPSSPERLTWRRSLSAPAIPTATGWTAAGIAKSTRRSTALHTLKKLLFGETWILPIGIAIITGAALLIRPLDRHL